MSCRILLVSACLLGVTSTYRGRAHADWMNVFKVLLPAAKAAGVSTGEPVHLAEAKYPGLVKLYPEYEKYVAYSRMIRRIYEDYTGNVESFSIDECWLDVTTYGKDFSFALKTAEDVRF
ncbi:MAG TPA: hypothetical protein PKM25_07730, partial [Candidatus Ozemobacteraceae bacterium]|nr:hypothetical protein [Candidatus Ozemobacteraceae bacterium]